MCDQETSKNEEAKVRYRAVKIQPQWVVTAGKQTNNDVFEITFSGGFLNLYKLRGGLLKKKSKNIFISILL
jgi:hypothetical protein